MKMTVAPCSMVEIDRYPRGAYCLHHQGDQTQRRSVSTRFHGATSWGTVIISVQVINNAMLTVDFNGRRDE
jgi:hypothetical protein